MQLGGSIYTVCQLVGVLLMALTLREHQGGPYFPKLILVQKIGSVSFLLFFLAAIVFLFKEQMVFPSGSRAGSE